VGVNGLIFHLMHGQFILHNQLSMCSQILVQETSKKPCRGSDLQSWGFSKPKEICVEPCSLCMHEGNELVTVDKQHTIESVHV